MKRVLQHSNEPVTISSLRDRKFIEVNEAFLDATGYRRDEVVGRTALELNLWDDPVLHERIGQDLAATGVVRHKTIRFRPKHGTVRIGLFSAAVQDIDGEPCCVSFITDVTEKLRAEKELRRSERRFRSYIENAADGLTVFDREGVITFATPSVQRIIGVELSEVVGRNYREFVHPDDLAFVRHAVEIFDPPIAGEMVVFRVRHNDGHWIFIEGKATLLPQSEDGPPQIVFNWRDITERKRADKRLDTTERRLRDIISHAPVVVSEFDVDGIMTMAEGNAIASDSVGTAGIGKSMFELFAGSREITGAVNHVLRGEAGSITAELNGRWFDIWGEPVRDSEGNVRGGIAVSTDVTARVLAEQRLEQEKEQFRVLIENTADIILVLGRDGTVLFASPSVERHTGYRVEDLVGTNALAYLDPDDRAQIIRSVEAAFSDRGSTLNVRFKLRSKSGEIHSYEAAGKVLPGKPDRVIVQERDVTRQEKYEIELASARDAALESSRLKSAFLANMSHEIRTPLNVILGYIDVIGDHLFEIGDVSQRECLEAAAGAGGRLIQTINGILDYSKIEAGGFECRPELLNLSDLVTHQVSDFRPLAHRKGIDIRFVDEAPGACIMADEYCISHALQNLIGNAIKFTERGWIDVRQFRHQGELSLEIRDSGAGIDAKFLGKLFQPFVQEHSGFSRKFEGTGLGLALTKRFLEANHARISVKSEKGAGAAFTINFSAQCESGNAIPGRPLGEATMALPRLLLVEDDHDTQAMMCAMLHDAFDLRVAASGDAVRNMVAEDLAIEGVLMDISLKGAEDGLQITSYLRGQARFHATPIIALTAHASAEHRRLALEAGCDAVLTKPVRRSEILEALNLENRSKISRGKMNGDGQTTVGKVDS